MPNEKIPPQNIEAEQAVLGGILLDKDAIIKVADILLPEDFYDDRHRIIFENCLSLFEKRSPIDLITLTDVLESQGRLEEVGGAAYLSEIVSATASSAHIVRYAEIVRSKSTLRKLIKTATEIIETSYTESEEISGVLDKAERSLLSVSEKFLKGAFVPVKSILSESFERIEELHQNRGEIRGVATGFRDLDNLLAGLQKSDLVILAARPSMGKSSLALNIAAYAAGKIKIPVGLFSLEMSKEQLVDRLLTMEAGIDSWRLRTGNLLEEDFTRLNYAMGVLSEAPIFIDDSPLLSVLEIRTKARRLQTENGLGLIVVDYLQLMEGRNPSGREINRVQEVSDISRSLKALARELSIPVLAVSQLSRAVEARSPKIPQLSDLRESGSIEQDADVVMFIYRDEYYNPDTDKRNIAQIFIRKHRNGPTGEIELFFKPEFSRFQTIEKKLEPEAVEVPISPAPPAEVEETTPIYPEEEEREVFEEG